MATLISKDEFKKMWELYKNDKEGLIAEGTTGQFRYEVSLSDAGWDDLMVCVDLFGYVEEYPDEVILKGVCDYIKYDYKEQNDDIEDMLNRDIKDAYSAWTII